MSVLKLAMIPSGYKATKLYSVLPTDGTGDFTVSRNSTATRVNKDGLIELVGANVPRLDYTNGCPELLVEPQVTQLATYSNDLTNAIWNKIGLTANTNAGISPDASYNANKIIEDSSTNGHFIYQSTPMIVGQTYTLSVFAKRSEKKWIKLVQYTNYANFNLENGTIGNSSSISTKIKELKNGWYRCSITFICTVNSIFDIKLGDNNTLSWDDNYFGDGVSGIFIYGIQLELGSDATSYIPNATSGTITRLTDLVYNTNLQTNNFVGVNNGSWFIKTGLSKGIGGISLLLLPTGWENMLSIYNSNDKVEIIYFISGIINFSHISTIDYSNSKILITWNNNIFKLFVNGSLVYTSPTQTSTHAFARQELHGIFNGLNIRIKKNELYNYAISDAEAITLTT